MPDAVTSPRERRLFGTDGVRGRAGEFLSADLALSLGRAAAVASGAATPQVLIVRDTRESGEMLEAALAAGIAAGGGDALLGGVLPTPGAALLVRRYGFDMAAVVSASHNPFEDNGIKFFGSDGMKLADDLEDAIDAGIARAPALEAAPLIVGSADGLGEAAVLGEAIEELTDGDERYLAFLLEGVPSLEGLRIIVDCANGAASNLAPEAYRDAGASVNVLHADPDGRNINDRSGSTHPEHLIAAVTATGAHLGIAHDGDADRMLAVDAHGDLVDGDQILGVLALEAHARGALPKDTVVTTVMANIGFRRAMADAGISLVETAVGDRYVPVSYTHLTLPTNREV